MLLTAARLLLLALVAAGPPTVLVAQDAEKPWKLGLPRQALALTVQPGWSVSQGAELPLTLSRGDCTITLLGPFADVRALQARLEAGTEEGAVAKPWKVPGAAGSKRMQRTGSDVFAPTLTLLRPSGPCHLIRVRVPGAVPDRVREVEAILSSFDARPFRHPRRLVDWKNRWTAELPEGWRVDGLGSQSVRLLSPDREETASIGVHVLGASPTGRDAAWTALLAKEFPGDGPGGTDANVSSSRMELADGTRARRFRATAKSGAAGRLELHRILTARLEVIARIKRPNAPESRQALKLLDGFRASPRPGPHAVSDKPVRFSRKDAPPVTYVMPADWEKEKPGSSMRLLQLRVPGREAASCIVWFFGPDRGGSVAANLRRWKSQFQLEGKPRLQVVKVAPGIRAHCIDASGTYVAETRPGSGTRVNKPGWRLLGAVLEVPGGPLFIKLAGPEKTVGAAAAVWMEWIRSFRKAVR